MGKCFFLGELKHGSVTYDNVISAFRSIRRLQIVYELEIEDIAHGNVDDYTFEKFSGN